MFNNSTLNSTRPGIPVPYYGKIPWTAAFSLQFVMAMMGNFLIVWIVFRDIRLRRSATNFLIANMAVSDLIAALFAFPWVLVDINFDYQWLIGGVIGNALCKIIFFTIEMSFGVSAYSCVAISIDRYYAVAYPLKRPFQDKLKQVIAVIWIVAAVVCSPNMYFRSTLQFSNIVYCLVLDKNLSSHLSYLNTWQGLTSILPMVLITFTYTFTICKLYHRKVPGLVTSERIRRRKQQNKKVLKHAVTIVVLLYLCRGFWFTFEMLDSQGELVHLSVSSYKNLMYASYFIFFVSLVYNFFIYLIFNDIYRENIKALIPKCCCRYDANMRQERPGGGEMIEMNELN